MNETKIRIKELLRERGLTYKTFAEMVGSTRCYVSNVANGKQQPTLTKLEQWAKVLDVPVTEMLTPKASEIVCPCCGARFVLKTE